MLGASGVCELTACFAASPASRAPGVRLPSSIIGGRKLNPFFGRPLDCLTTHPAGKMAPTGHSGKLPFADAMERLTPAPPCGPVPGLGALKKVPFSDGRFALVVPFHTLLGHVMSPLRLFPDQPLSPLTPPLSDQRTGIRLPKLEKAFFVPDYMPPSHVAGPQVRAESLPPTLVTTRRGSEGL